VIGCLCNSRIAQPAHAGQAAAWPLVLLWGGLLVAVAAGAFVWFARYRRRRPSPGTAVPERWPVTATDLGAEDAGVGDDPLDGGAEDLAGPPALEAEAVQRR
jgi:hypothetical protein